MAMVENSVFVDDRKEEVGDNGGLGLNSPWKKPVEKPAESPVMGEKAWPALSDVKLAKTADVSNSDSQVKQICDAHKNSEEGGRGNSSNKHGQQRYHRSGPKRSHTRGPPYPVVYYPEGVAASPPIPGPAYVYPPMPAPFPNVDNRSTKSGSQIPMNAFGVYQNFQPPPQADLSVGRIPSTVGGGVAGGYMYQRWQGPKSGVMMHQEAAPGAYMSPAFIRPGPLVRGPAFPGPVNMHFHPMPPLGWTGAPPFSGFPPRPVNSLACSLPPELLALRVRIIKQIEYYFSDENLQTDHYLISKMDDNGWVPISLIADFKRVKRMCTDVRFILDALQHSTSVEVQGNMVRKCQTTPKLPVVAEGDSKVNHNLPSEASPDSQTRDKTESPSESVSKVGASSSDGDSFDATSECPTASEGDPKVNRNLPSELCTHLKPGHEMGSPSESDSKVDPYSDSDTFDAIADNAVMLSLSLDSPAANVDKLSNDFSSALVT